MDKLNKIRLGNIITEYREKQGETQKELAEKIGYNRYQQVSYIENGAPNRNLTFDQLITIAKHYNVSTDYLLGLTDTPTPLKTDEQRALRTSCDYTGLSEKTISLLKSKNSERKENKKENKWTLENYIENNNEILEKLIDLYFKKLRLSIVNYITYGKTLKNGIQDYKQYLKNKKKEALTLIEKTKASGEYKGGNPELNEFYLNFPDDIIEYERETIRDDLTFSNSDLFELQDTFISFVKGLSDVEKLKDECYQLINDNSIFDELHKMFSEIYKDECIERGEDNEKE